MDEVPVFHWKLQLKGELKIMRIVAYWLFCRSITPNKLFNAFIGSQFSYRLLIRICLSKMLNNKMNSVHQKCLRLIYKDKHSKIYKLLRNNCRDSVHTRELNIVATEMFELTEDISPTIIQKFFRFRNNRRYDLKHFWYSI